MSNFTHSMCSICWVKQNGHLIAPIILVERELDTCCFCGKQHRSGIYVRQDPEGLRCQGVHGVAP